MGSPQIEADLQWPVCRWTCPIRPQPGAGVRAINGNPILLRPLAERWLWPARAERPASPVSLGVHANDPITDEWLHTTPKNRTHYVL